MAEDGDRLIHRYLEGLLSGEEARLLNERVKADPRVRRRLAEMAFDTVQFREGVEAGPAVRPEAPPAPARPAWWSGPRSSLAAAAIILLAVGIAILLRPSPPPAEEKAGRDPAAAGTRERGEAREAEGDGILRGFRGRVRGVVEEKGDAHVALRVASVAPSEDGRSRALVGRLVRVEAGREEKEGGEKGPIASHAAFLRKVRKGQEVELDLRHDRGGSLAIARLTEEQADWAGIRAKEGDREGDRKRERDAEGEGDRKPEKKPVREARDGERPERKGAGKEEDRER